MKIYCVFYLSFLSFIFLVYKIPSAGEIKSNKLDKIFENNSKIPSNTIDNFDSKGFFKKNKVEKKEEKKHDDLVIYITSPRSIQSNEGFFQIHINTFNPIREIKINEEKYKIDNLSYESSHDYANKKLKPGENKLVVEVITDIGKTEKEFKIFLEDSFYKFSDMRKSSFTLVNVFGLSKDNNANSSPSEKVEATKGSVTIVAIGQMVTGYSSAFVITTILNFDDQFDSKYDSKQIIFRQLGIDWNDQKTSFGDFTLGTGMNMVGLWDKEEQSEIRDPLNKKYKKIAQENFYQLKLKVNFNDFIKWETSLKHSMKDDYSTLMKTEETPPKVYVSKLSQGFETNWLDLNWLLALDYSTTDAESDTKDFSSSGVSLKMTWPLNPVSLNLQYGITDQQNKVADPLTGIRTKNYSFFVETGANYQINSRLSLAYSHRYEVNESNIINSDYSKNTDTLNFTLIY